MDKEVYKQWFGQVVRILVGMFFGMLVSKKILPEEWSNILLESSIGVVTTFLLGALPFVWGFLKVRYTVIYARIARCVSPDTPMGEIVRLVKAKHKFITKI